MHRADCAGRALALPGVGQLLSAVERISRWPANRLTVLTYHRIDDERDDGRAPALLSATPSEFAAQVDWLAGSYCFVGIDDVLAALAGHAALPKRALLLTFDDAVDDFRTNAWPILERAGVPALVFVPTGFVGRPTSFFWWDAVHAALSRTARREPYDSPAGTLPMTTAAERANAYRLLRAHLKQIPYDEVAPIVAQMCDELGSVPPPAAVMDWNALRALSLAGVQLCPHTRTHPHLDQMPINDVRTEIEGSLEDLRREVGDVPLAFAYPGGQLTPQVREVVANAGFRAAFSTRRGANAMEHCDPLTLCRINVSRRTGLGAARIQMHPWADRISARTPA